MRKKTVIMILCHSLLAVLTGLCLAGPALPAAAGAEKYYVENEWNYVDISMPVNSGIPEDAQGVLGQIGRIRTGPIRPEPSGIRTGAAAPGTRGRIWSWRDISRTGWGRS